MQSWDVIIIGAGAAGLMCAAIAGQRGRKVLLLDHAQQVGKKILIAGGGRCNFTNLYVEPANYVSANPHFCKSALARYTQWDFIALVEKYQIAYHQRDHGQLFCNDSARQIVDMLLSECGMGEVVINTHASIKKVVQSNDSFIVNTSIGDYQALSLVIATGGLSIPKMGATGLGLNLARQFGLNVIDTLAALVPMTLHQIEKELYQSLSGISVNAQVTTADGHSFTEALLFTHRGLSGPVILQASCYWKPAEYIAINLLPEMDLEAALTEQQRQHPQQTLRKMFSQWLPKRLVELRLHACELFENSLNQITSVQRKNLIGAFQCWQIKPNATEGYRTAEATRGGVDTDELSSKTMMAKKVPGLYFIGEVVDVTGQLGGFNLQWAWSSGHAAGEVV